MLHTRMLRYLDEVARLGSIRKAGEKLNVASSAINRQILALEEELGTPIFQRLPRKLVLTAAGELLISHARTTMKAVEKIRSQIAELKGLHRGEIRLACMSGLLGNVVPLALKRFRQNHRLVKLDLQLLLGPEIAAAVARGEADLGFGFDLPDHGQTQTLFSMPFKLGAVMNPHHSLAGRSSLRLADCLPHPLFIADATMAIRPHLDTACARADVKLDPILETNSVEIMRHMAMEEDCITFLTPIDIIHERRDEKLVYVPLRDMALTPQYLSLIGRSRGQALSPHASIIAEMLKSIVQDAA